MQDPQQPLWSSPPAATSWQVTWRGVGKAESTQKSYAAYRAEHERLIGDGSVVVDGAIVSLATWSSPRPPAPARSRWDGDATAAGSGPTTAAPSPTGKAEAWRDQHRRVSHSIDRTSAAAASPDAPMTRWPMAHDNDERH